MKRSRNTRRLTPFLAAPTKTGLLIVGPVVLAIVQLANSAVNGLSPPLAVGFAAVMCIFAATVASHHVSAYRLRQLQRRYGIPR